jgi:hypothetical protein
MKHGTFLWSGVALRAAGIAVLALAVMFAACSNPAGGGGESGGNANKTALNAAIETAEAAKVGVQSSTNGADVALTIQWVTLSQLTAFNTAINAAKTVRDNTSASQPQVDGAVTTLDNAISDFKDAKQPGTLELNWSALDAKIAAAKIARDSIIVAVNAASAAQDAKWATQAQLDALQAAITVAETLTPTSQTMVDNAVTALDNALATFNSAVSGHGTGTKIGDFSQADFDSLIAMANAAKERVFISSLNGDDVPPADVWVTSAVMGELNVAISTAAEAVLSDLAYETLLGTLTTFNEAKQPGATIDQTDFNTAIKNANTARAGVEIAISSDQVPTGVEWVTKAQWDALDTVYTAAADAATKKVVSDLNAAIEVFKSAKKTGTAVNALTITGLGAIYKNGAEVYVGVLESNEFDPSSEPDNFEQGIVTNGSLTISLGTLENGSYYVGFSSDGIIIFISKATVAFKGAMKNIAYDTANFELYTHSLNLGDMDLSPTMTLNQVILAMSQGEMNNYTEWKAGMQQIISEMLGDKYINPNFLPIALYKDEACTVEINGTETVGSVSVIYTKFSITALMGGGESGGGDPPGTVGHINGTVTFTNGSPGQIDISARYSTEQNVYGTWLGNVFVKPDGSFSIPFNQEFLTTLQSESQQYLHFSLWKSHDDNSGYDIEIASARLVTFAGLNNGNLNVNNVGTVNLAFITVSGTITVTYKGQPVHHVRIFASYGSASGYSSELKSPGSGAAWSVPVPVFDSSTPLYLYVSGYDSDEKQLFGENAEIIINAYNTPVTGVAINLGNIIALSGTANVTINGQRPDTISIFAYTDPLGGSSIGSATISNYASGSNTWSMGIKEPASGKVYFGINWWLGGGSPEGALHVADITYSGGSVSSIFLEYHEP